MCHNVNLVVRKNGINEVSVGLVVIPVDSDERGRLKVIFVCFNFHSNCHRGEEF